MDDTEGFPLADSTDNAILMHRDVHFGGNFDFMIDYYEKEGKGANPEFELTRIKELQAIERKVNQNLAAVLLSGPDAERIAQAKDAYQKLRKIYETKLSKKVNAHHPKLIADLILSEDEEPFSEIDAIVAEKNAIVPALLDLVRAEDFYDVLFPGYGFAPGLAVKCLGLIGDRRAIVSLFEATGGESDFIFEDRALAALKAIGDPAKEFLLHVLHARPITYDNERAAVALVQFKEDPKVAHVCLDMLKSLDLKKNSVLATYLILACEGLDSTEDRKDLAALMNTAPKTLQQDFKIVAGAWQEQNGR